MRILAFLLLLPALSVAQVPHTFQNGDVADADKINQNFETLSDRIDALADPFGVFSRGQPFHEVLINCDTQPAALQTYLEQGSAIEFDRLKFNIVGNCVLTDDQLISNSYRHVWLAGSTTDGAFSEGDCSDQTKITYTNPDSNLLTIGAVATSLWISCITFDARLNIQAYGHAYVRFGPGVKTANPEQLLTVGIRANSTFRTFYANRIDSLLIRNDSLVEMNSVDNINIGSLIVKGRSMFACRFCFNGTVNDAEIRQGSNLTFLAQRGLINIEQLVGRERSQVNIENISQNPELYAVTVNEQILEGDSVIYESIYGQ